MVRVLTRPSIADALLGLVYGSVHAFLACNCVLGRVRVKFTSIKPVLARRRGSGQRNWSRTCACCRSAAAAAPAP